MTGCIHISKMDKPVLPRHFSFLMCDYIFKGGNMDTQQSKFFLENIWGNFKRSTSDIVMLKLSLGSLPKFCEVDWTLFG